MIAHYYESEIFGIVYCVLFSALFIIYSIIYEKAFAIPGEIERTKRNIILRAERSRYSQGVKHSIVLQVRSVWPGGIQVGRFHVFERASTPIFVDFVLRNIVNLVVIHYDFGGMIKQ